ncbi:metallophosphoesterase [Pseudomonas sp. X4]|uniref:metallophosphoesterase n=1 Tax=Pseudomonas sp. X4 TaxID=3231526 RepID=UPI0034616F2D
MKLLIYSDLHLEFADFEPPDVRPDLVILAGDISTRARGVIWACYAFECPVLYVAGNHEYYQGHMDATFKQMQEAASPHVHVLNNACYVLDGVRFLLTTGWTDFTSTGDRPAAMRICSEWMTDYQAIRTGEEYRRLRPSDVVNRNHKARDFLARELAVLYEGNTVVITHHCPVPEVAGDKHDGHLLAAYTNQWHYLVDRADAWVLGHTHQFVDTHIGDCRVISNPRGYPSEHTGFVHDFTIEL